jgi:hypothetical protein
MNNRILLLAFILMTFCLPAHALEIEGIAVPETIRSGDGKTGLVLNGAGLREKLYVDVYVAALYLQARTPDVAAILSDDGPASVIMHIIYSEISKKKITDGWIDGLDDNTTVSERKAIQPRLEAFNKLFTAMQKGDVLRIDYTPAKGTEVRLNGEWRGSIEGNDFFRALLKVWLGSDPVDKSLKKDMLGNS